MTHILLTQVKDKQEMPMVVRIDSLSYTNQSAHSSHQYINLSDGIACIEVKESASEILERIQGAYVWQ